MSAKLGFIGCGNMASAIINGAVSSGFLKKTEIAVYDVDSAKAGSIDGITVCDTYDEVINGAYAVVLAVKPQVFSAVLPEIKKSVAENSTAVISIGAGKTLEFIGSFLNEKTPIVRVMPNINAKVGAAMSAVCRNENADDSVFDFVKKLCNSFGEVIELPEEQFPLFGVIAGCSPAYTFMYIDAMARAAVKNGMNKQNALKICAQAVLGSAKMIMEDSSHPWSLIDSVCSPGGTTIEGVVSLQKDGFESAIVKAVDASLEKDRKL